MVDRRTVLKHAAAFSGLGLIAGLPGTAVARALAADTAADDRTLVVFELTGGNDGLNTIVPYGDDAYYRLRPNIGIRPSELMKLDDYWGMNAGMSALSKFWDTGQLAIIHGCGHHQPSFAHSVSSRILRTSLTSFGRTHGIVTGDGKPQLQTLNEAIATGLAPRISFVRFGNDAFDTHARQPERHQKALSLAGGMLSEFLRQVEKIGQGSRVVVLVTSEFGRSAQENGRLGTDHGTANTMFLIGKSVHGGHYGTPPSLNDLDARNNLHYTTDFRQVCATVMDEWLGADEIEATPKSRFDSIPIFS